MAGIQTDELCYDALGIGPLSGLCPQVGMSRPRPLVAVGSSNVAGGGSRLEISMKQSDAWYWAAILLFFLGTVFLLLFGWPRPEETQTALAHLRLQNLVELALLFAVLAKLRGK